METKKVLQGVRNAVLGGALGYLASTAVYGWLTYLNAVDIVPSNIVKVFVALGTIVGAVDAFTEE